MARKVSGLSRNGPLATDQALCNLRSNLVISVSVRVYYYVTSSDIFFEKKYVGFELDLWTIFAIWFFGLLFGVLVRVSQFLL